jgi:hypothetical protein
VTQWYIHRNGRQGGPFSSQQLKNLASRGDLDPSDHIWKDGMKDWAEASRLKGLFSENPVDEDEDEDDCDDQASKDCESNDGTEAVASENEVSFDFKKYWILALVGSLFLLLVCCGGLGALLDRDGSSDSDGNEGEIQRVTTVMTLLNDYDNEVAGDKKYKGKTIVVGGPAIEVKEGYLQTGFTSKKKYQVTIGGLYLPGGYTSWIYCFVEKPDELESVRNGDFLMIKGKVEGAKFGKVIMSNCKLLSRKPQRQ